MLLSFKEDSLHILEFTRLLSLIAGCASRIFRVKFVLLFMFDAKPAAFHLLT